MVIYEVYGNPVPWAAPKRCGDRYYNPKHDEKVKATWQLKAQCNHPPFTCPLWMSLTFYMPIPASTSGIRRKQMLGGAICHIVKPDRTNLLKFIEDCMQEAGIVSNDSIIVDGPIKKIYGAQTKTVIMLKPLQDHHQDLEKEKAD